MSTNEITPELEYVYVHAQSQIMTATWYIEDKRITPEWIRKQVELHRKAADVLEDVAEYMEQNDMVIG